PFNNYARPTLYAEVTSLSAGRRQHPLFEHRQTLAHRAVHHRISNLDDQSAEDCWIVGDVRHYLFAKQPRQLARQSFLFRLRRLARHGHVRVQAVFRLIDQRVVLDGDSGNQHLPPLVDHRREIAQEKLGNAAPAGSAKRLVEDLDFLRGSQLGRLEKSAQGLVFTHRRCDRIEKLAPLLDVAALAGERAQRLGVVPADRRVVHPRLAPPVGIEERKLSTIFRFDWSSRFFSMTLLAPAIASSTASRRISAIARSFSCSISRRARSSICCCCWCVSSIICARTLSPTWRPSTMSFCASALAASTWRCCSPSMRAASALSRLAPSIASSSACSRASTAAVVVGKTSLPRM